MSAPANQEEKKYAEIEEPSELATILQTSVDNLNAVVQQLSDAPNEKVNELITKLKANIESAQTIEKSLTKDTANLQTELSTFKTKFGALKWSQVQQKGYPTPRRDDTAIDIYTNSAGDEVKVNDAYRWLEDPDSKESRQWIEEQVDITTAYLHESGDTVSTIYKTLEDNLNFPRYGTPSRKGSDPVIYHYTHNSGLQNQSVLYCHEGSLDAPRKCLIDPNTLSEDGTTSTNGRYYFSENGKYLCYGVNKSGSDWTEFHVKEVLSGKELDDVLMWCKFTGICWTHDNEGFFYSRYDKPQSNKDADKKGTETEKLSNQQLWYHTLGTKQEDDTFLIDGVTMGDAEWMTAAGMTWCGKWLELYITNSCDPVNRLYLVDISDPKTYSNADTFQKAVIKLVDNFDFGYEAINNEDTLFYFKTNNAADNYRVVSYDIKGFKPDEATSIQWTEIVPETKYRMEDASVVGKDKILLKYNEDVKTVIKLIDFKGNTVKHDITFPAAGSVRTRGSKKHNEGFFYFTSFLYPGSIYQYDFDTNTQKLWKAITVKGFNSDDYQTKQVFYASKDGTKIPMYILSKKGLVFNGENPTILYGYGGFDISLNPSFQVSKVLWLKHTQGVYCTANLRGGGEYGQKWHKAGIKANKQNVFDDFHAAAQYLMDEKYTNAKKLAIEGGSNGGLLVSACCNQRPDLYQCGVAHCGVLDMLKFHKFTIGYAWISDYGCADNKEEFDALYQYSPLVNIPTEKEMEDRQYPCYMATTADHDDRVSPLHSFKFVAELQDRLGRSAKQANPLLIRIECKSGHGSSSLKKGIEMRADTFAFMLKCLGAEWK